MHFKHKIWFVSIAANAPPCLGDYQGFESLTNRQFASMKVGAFFISECSSVWLERCVWDAKAQGSNPCTPTQVSGTTKIICIDDN